MKLSFGSEIVTVGFIQKLHPDEVVYNEKVSEGRVAVCVDTVIREDLLLSYPTPRAQYLRDAVHSLIFWDIKDTFLYDSSIEHRPAKRPSMGSINLHPVEGEKDEDGDELKVNDKILVLSVDAYILGSGIVHYCDKDATSRELASSVALWRFE